MSKRGARVAVAVLAALAGLAGTAHAADGVKTLAECVEIALARHPSIGSADANVDAGRARIYEAGSGYLPKLAGVWASDRSNSGGFSRSANLSSANGVGSLDSGNSFDFHQGAVTLSQTIFDFGQTFAAIRAAQARRDSLAADADTTRMDIVLGVKQSYFGLLAARRLLFVADETVRDNQRQLDLARGRNEVGFAPRLDVTRSEVQVASGELDQLSARNAVAVAEATLANALGLDGPLPFDIEDVLASPGTSLDEPTALARAFEQRPELRSVSAQQRATQQDVNQHWRELLPTVRADATYGGSGSEMPLDEDWRVGASVDVPIFDGGLTLARVGESKANLHSLRFEEQRLRQQITLEVRRALLDVARAAEAITVTERAAGQARENLELAEGRYETGVGNVTELTDAQTARTRAEADRVRALYDHQTAIATLEQAIAQELPKP